MKGVGLPDALGIGLEWQRDGDVAIIHVVADRGDTPDPSKLVIASDGRVAGSLPAQFLGAAVSAARDALEHRRSRMYSIHATPEGGEIRGIQGGEIDIFVEVMATALSLVIAGAGHIAQPLAALGTLLGFDVTVIDDRPEFANSERFPDAQAVITEDFVTGLRSVRLDRDAYVVLVTRGHAHDAACLRHVLSHETAYIGMIGSKMRIRTVFEQLNREGIPAADLRRVYAPIGVDIGSHTPPEIAVAIAAEIIQVHRGGRSPHLKLEWRTRE